MSNEPISGYERQEQILELINAQKRITVAVICEQFQVSEATARRDLESLAAEGKIQRVHGGAISLQQAPPELPMLERQDEFSIEKQRIGRAAAGLVKAGETVFLGSGSTVLEVARCLRELPTLTVVTNSLPVINALAGCSGITLVCLGGILRTSEFSFIGHITEQALSELRVSKVFIGTRAISIEQGLTNDYLPETMTDRAIMRAGQEVIVLADHSKFGRIAAAFLAPVESVNLLVTDAQTDSLYLNALQARGVRVLSA